MPCGRTTATRVPSIHAGSLADRTNESLSHGLSGAGFGDIDDCLGKSLRSLLRQIVSDAARNGPVLVSGGEFLRVGTRVRVRGTIGISLKRNRGNTDDRGLSELLFDVVELRLALGETEPPTVVVNDNVYMIRVLEGRRRAIEGGIVEFPFR